MRKLTFLNQYGQRTSLCPLRMDYDFPLLSLSLVRGCITISFKLILCECSVLVSVLFKEQLNDKVIHNNFPDHLDALLVLTRWDVFLSSVIQVNK